MFEFDVTARHETEREILDNIIVERERQDKKWGLPRLSQSLDRCMTILTEEVGEVAEAILENDRESIRMELIQVAAVAVATVEAMDTGRI